MTVDLHNSRSLCISTFHLLRRHDSVAFILHHFSKIDFNSFRAGGEINMAEQSGQGCGLYQYGERLLGVNVSFCLSCFLLFEHREIWVVSIAEGMDGKRDGGLRCI